MIDQLVAERFNGSWWPTPRPTFDTCLRCGQRVRDDTPCPHCSLAAANRRIAAQKNGKAA